MREAKLRAAQAVIETYAETYRNRKRELNYAEIALYEAALKIGLRMTLPPKDAKAAIQKFEGQIAEERARAEAAREARQKKTQESPPPLAS